MLLSLTRNAPRVVAAVACFLFILLLLHLVDILGQYRAYDYLLASVTSSPLLASNRGSALQDKIIVMAKLEREDTSWVEEMVPESDRQRLPH